MNHKLKTYIDDVLKIKRNEAARQLHISRQHLYEIINEVSFPSRKLSLEIERWSHGFVTAEELLKIRER